MEEKRKVKLTGEPISDELADIITRLNNNERVGIEEIENTKEIKMARGIVNYSRPTYLFPDRQGIRDNVYNILMEKGSAKVDENGKVEYNGIVKRESRFDVVLGLPASGKSSSLCDKISEEFGSRIVDCDEAKKYLPEFNNGWGANVVHDESQLISNKQLKYCFEKKENIVFPKVGGNLKKIEDDILNAKANGYKVYVHYVSLSRNKALGRMLNRFVETGRFLPPDLVEKYDNELEGNRILKTYNKFKERCDFNGINEGTMFMSVGVRGYGNIREGGGCIEQGIETSIGTSGDVGRPDKRGMGRDVYEDRLRIGKGGFDETGGIRGNGRKPEEVFGVCEEALRGMEKNDTKGAAYNNKEAVQGRDSTVDCYVDGFTLWDNDVNFGEKPMLVEAYCEGQFVEEGKKNTAFIKDVLSKAENAFNTVGFPKHYEAYVRDIVFNTALSYEKNPKPRVDILIGYDNPQSDFSFLAADLNIVFKAFDNDAKNIANDLKALCSSYRQMGFEEVRFHYINDGRKLMHPQQQATTGGELAFTYIKHSDISDGYTCHLAKEGQNNGVGAVMDVNGYESKRALLQKQKSSDKIK